MKIPMVSLLMNFNMFLKYFPTYRLNLTKKREPGYFVLTGSQNFLMNQAITQSLAGRIGILTLLPLSLHELISADLLSNNVNETLLKGGYPGYTLRIYS